MAIVQSFGQLQAHLPAQPGAAAPPGRAYAEDLAHTYEAMYRTQPSVRTVVDFVARNVAQLGLHVYRRISDLDRERLADHELARWLQHPNDDTTGYRLTENLMQDLGIYGRGYWLKVRAKTRVQFVRIPPAQIYATGWMVPTGFLWTLPDGTEVPLPVRDVVFFRYYDPDDPLGGLSPLETLRPLLTEESSARAWRKSFWQNAARIEGVVERPLAAPKWSTDQKQSFREQWQARYGNVPGQTAVLDEGMTFRPVSFSARDSELTDSRKLTREEVASAYHVPLPLVGILDHATFSNIREQHKNLYQDCLGPSLEMLQQEYERQLLPDCDDQDRVYCEFNIADKLKGSFEEQGETLQRLVGRPVMTANEGRARLNLPSIQDDPTANQLALPLNTAGGAGTPLTAPQDYRAEAAPIIQATLRRQCAALAKYETPRDRVSAFDAERWDRELAADLARVYRAAGVEPLTAANQALQLAMTTNANTVSMLSRDDDPFAAVREESPHHG